MKFLVANKIAAQTAVTKYTLEKDMAGFLKKEVSVQQQWGVRHTRKTKKKDIPVVLMLTSW
jgi:vacuolar-type H+-ATPase catalytic subunit A/Vma1